MDKNLRVNLSIGYAPAMWNQEDRLKRYVETMFKGEYRLSEIDPWKLTVDVCFEVTDNGNQVTEEAIGRDLAEKGIYFVKNVSVRKSDFASRDARG